MVNSPKSEVIEGGGKLARALNDKGVEVTFGKRSEGNDDLSTVINMAANQINSSSNVDIVTEWEETLSDEKVPSEKLTKNTLDIKADKTNGVSQITDPNAHSNLGTNANATQSSINSAIDSMIGSGVSIGTFTDLKNAINDANGVLVLDRDYKYNATVDTSVVLDYGIPIEKNITIIGNGHIIDGNDTVRALSISGEYVVNLYDLRIQNCKSTINAFGGAIYIEDTTVNMINLQIINNSVVGDSSVGGAIAAWDSTVNITNTEFIQNKVTGIETRAGAIFIIGNISLNNCTFEDNTATLRAGAIHANGALSMIDCSFKDNTATNYANIYSNNTVTVYDCIIPNINTSCYNVSNITTESLSTSKQNTLVSGTNIKTINNESILGSGNISTESAGSFDDLETLINDSYGSSILTLHKDYVNDGSYSSDGILLNHDTELIIDGRGHILDAQYNGRIFQVFNDNVHVNINLKFRNIIFLRGDISDDNGGAVYINNATVTFENCGFIDNYAINGGSIYLEDGDLILFDSYFKWGDAGNYADIYSYKSISVYNCNIPDIATSCYNVTNKPYLTDHQNITGKQDTLVSGTNIKTVNNESLLGSGNIIIQGGGIEVGTFTDLQTLITNATAPSGQIPIIILDKDYKYNNTTDSSLTDGIVINKNITIIGNGHIIDGNNSKRAFYISGQYTFNLSDIRIQNCNESYGGGAIYANSATININNIQFTNNTTTGTYGYGGAIYARNGASVNINNTIFDKNSATEYSGGAIHINGILSMINCSFKNNTATNYANIYSNNTVTVYDCIIPNINTSCYNVSNITTESLYDAIEGLEEDMLL